MKPCIVLSIIMGEGIHVYLCFHYLRPEVMSLSREAEIMINWKRELMTDH